LKIEKSIPLGIIIPARLDSTRLSRKLLIDVYGIPMIEHVRRRAILNSFGIPVVVATGDHEIASKIESYGGYVLKTNEIHENGMSRVGESHETLDWERYIVLQGDEILINPVELDGLIELNLQDQGFDSCNVITRINSPDQLEDSSVVKCVVGVDGKIKYIFRRSPFTVSQELQKEVVYKICGLFSLTASLLKMILTFPQTPLAKLESIEQLKILELGFDLMSYKSNLDFPSVNLAKDLDEVMDILKENTVQKLILKSILLNDPRFNLL
jgi:3-deoxy-manno-octulosonate cytidylyltransferase (CMP-KDO synthetase)